MRFMNKLAPFLRKESFLLFFILSIMACQTQRGKSDFDNVTVAEDMKKMIQIPNDTPYVISPKKKEVLTLPSKLIVNKMPEMSGKTPYIDNLSYVLLDTENGLINKIHKMLFYKKHIYIWDYKQLTIFIFDRDGNSINKIQSIGRGPNEYNFISDFDIDKEAEELILYATGSKTKTMHYDLKGIFLREKTTEIRASGMKSTSNSFLFQATFGQTRNPDVDNYAMMTEKNDSVRYVGFPFFPCEKKYNLIHSMHPLFKNYKNDVLYHREFTDSIYHITSDSTFRLHAYLDVSGNKPLYEKYDKPGLKKEQIRSIDSNTYQFFNSKFLETSNSIATSIQYPGKGVYEFALFEKSKGRFFHVENQNRHHWWEYEDGSRELLNLFPAPSYVSDDDRYVGYIYPSLLMELLSIKERYNNKEIEIKDRKLKTVIEEFNENSNPLLVFYDIKF